MNKLFSKHCHPFHKGSLFMLTLTKVTIKPMLCQRKTGIDGENFELSISDEFFLLEQPVVPDSKAVSFVSYTLYQV